MITNALVSKKIFTIPLLYQGMSEHHHSTLRLLKQRHKTNEKAALLQVQQTSEDTQNQKRPKKNKIQKRKSLSIDLKEQVIQSKHLSTYYAVAQINKVPFNFLLDTASSELWVPSSECKTKICSSHHRLPVGKMKAKMRHAPDVSIEYLSGNVEGKVLRLDVTIAGIDVPDQQIEVANQVDVPLLGHVKWDGILGLGFPGLSGGDSDEERRIPIFDHIMKENLLGHAPNSFAYYIGDRGSSFSFGGPDCTLLGHKKNVECDSDFATTPLSDKTYWTINIQGLDIDFPNGKKVSNLCSKKSCSAVIDTGTYLLYGPSDQVQRLGTFSFSCDDLSSLPTLKFRIRTTKGTTALLVVEPRDYILYFDGDDGTKDCVAGIAADDQPIWTFGQTFLKSHYTVFNRDDETVSFAKIQS